MHLLFLIVKILSFSPTNSSTKQRSSLSTIKPMQLSESFLTQWDLSSAYLSTRECKKLKVEVKITWKSWTLWKIAPKFKVSCISLALQSCFSHFYSSFLIFLLSNPDKKEQQLMDTWFSLLLDFCLDFLFSCYLAWFKEKENWQHSWGRSWVPVSGQVCKECQ